jgi:5-methyltetrahydrofolate--homocysteine methyltransferase
VLDASRAVGVVSGLLSPTERDRHMAETRAEYVRVREQFARGQSVKQRTALIDARANGHVLEFSEVHRPTFTGVRTFDAYDLEELAAHIDWTPFFSSWELAGRYPMILEDEVVGEAARSLFADAQAMLRRIVEERLLTARGVVGFWPANRDGDDLVLWTDETRTHERARLHTLRQQMAKAPGKAHAALADFVAPVGTPDWIGAFAVTAGHGEAELSGRYKAAATTTTPFWSPALADRLAEAFAEVLHLQVRRDCGPTRRRKRCRSRMRCGEVPGHPPGARLSRPAGPHRKATLFELLDVTAATGMRLTESFAMTPPASVSGLYFAHPEAHYFGVGKIERDQAADYAGRKGWDLATAERWLSPILNYEPDLVRDEAA